jgi:hypothetical protein
MTSTSSNQPTMMPLLVTPPASPSKDSQMACHCDPPVLKRKRETSSFSSNDELHHYFPDTADAVVHTMSFNSRRRRQRTMMVRPRSNAAPLPMLDAFLFAPSFPQEPHQHEEDDDDDDAVPTFSLRPRTETSFSSFLMEPENRPSQVDAASLERRNDENVAPTVVSSKGIPLADDTSAIAAATATAVTGLTSPLKNRHSGTGLVESSCTPSVTTVAAPASSTRNNNYYNYNGSSQPTSLLASLGRRLSFSGTMSSATTPAGTGRTLIQSLEGLCLPSLDVVVSDATTTATATTTTTTTTMMPTATTAFESTSLPSLHQKRPPQSPFNNNNNDHNAITDGGAPDMANTNPQRQRRRSLTSTTFDYLATAWRLSVDM